MYFFVYIMAIGPTSDLGHERVTPLLAVHPQSRLQFDVNRLAQAQDEADDKAFIILVLNIAIGITEAQDDATGSY